jgi:hypothetical protein
VPDRCTPSQQPARHAFETRERGEAATADSARHRVRPASPEQRVQDDGVDRGLINLFMQAISSGEFIRLDPNDQDPINVTGGECSQMSVPRQTAFPVRSSNVRESEGWRISVRAGLKELEASSSNVCPKFQTCCWTEPKIRRTSFPSINKTHSLSRFCCPHSVRWSFGTLSHCMNGQKRGT